MGSSPEFPLKPGGGAFFLRSFRPLIGHCDWCHDLGIIRTPVLSLLEKTTPSSSSIVDSAVEDSLPPSCSVITLAFMMSLGRKQCSNSRPSRSKDLTFSLKMMP